MVKYKTTTTIIFAFITALVFSQENFIVFKLSGDVLINEKKLGVGQSIASNDKLFVQDNAMLIVIDKVGSSYRIDKKGGYKYEEIKDYKVTLKTVSLTNTYLKYVYNNLLNIEEKDDIIGGVYRGEILMITPLDSSKVASNKISFTWTYKSPNINEKRYFLIENMNTDEILKIEVLGNGISLYKKDGFLKSGESYRWLVSSKEYPNLKNSVYYQLKVISMGEYEIIYKQSSSLIADLENINLSSEEIADALCRIKRLCK